MAAVVSQGTVPETSKSSRGAARKAAGQLKNIKISQLTGLLQDAVGLLKDTGSCDKGDTLIDRIVCVIPGIESAMCGGGGRISARRPRMQRNRSLHAPVGSAAVSSMDTGSLAYAQRGNTDAETAESSDAAGSISSNTAGSNPDVSSVDGSAAVQVPDSANELLYRDCMPSFSN